MMLGVLVGLCVFCGPVLHPAVAAEGVGPLAAQVTPRSTATGTPAPTATPTPTDDLGALCAAAAKLTSSGQPADALALIEKIRGQVRNNALPATTACEGERLAAVLAAQRPASPTPSTPAQDAGADWKQFVAGWATPLTDAGLALVGLLVAFLVIGRLLVFIPKMPFFRMRPWTRVILLLGGLGLMLIGSVCLVLALGTAAGMAADPGRTAWGTLALGWGFVALCGAAALAFYFSSRLRVSLEVRGADGKSSDAEAAHIADLLHELGAAPPKGIEIPIGTDVSALDDTTLTAMFSNKFLAAAQKVVTSIFGVTPWRVTVWPVGENALAVVITRNGWAVVAANVDRQAFNLPGPAPGIAGAEGKAGVPKAGPDAKSELHKMAAALILVTLAGRHYGFDGLCGATDWRSVGLHCVATTDRAISDEREQRLLGAAVDLDKENLLAEVAFQRSRLRWETDGKVLERYAEWLWAKAVRIRSDIDAGVIRRSGYLALLYRIETTFLSAVLNLLATEDGEEANSDLRARGRDVARRLIVELEQTPESTVPAPLSLSMRLHAALAHRDLLNVGDRDALLFDDLYQQALASVAPRTAYDAACSLARKSGAAAEADVTRRLGYAFTDPQLKEWARKDPELEELRKSEDFLDFLGVKPRADFWRLEAFEPYQKRLREAGIERPGDLYQKDVGQSAISAYLEVSPLVLKRLCRLAALVRRAQDVRAEGDAEPVHKYRVEVVGALVQAGIESPEEIHVEWLGTDMPPHAQAGEFVKQLRESIKGRVLSAPEVGQLKEWLRQLKDTHDT